MNFSPRQAPRAFTLIELLTVISIIAILMALLFPAISLVKEQANKAKARSDVSGIATAVKQYNLDYGKYPIIEEDRPAEDAEKDAVCGSSKANAKINNNALFNTLRAIPEGLNKEPKPHRMNPKRVVFFEGKAVTNTAQPRGGFLDKEGAGGDGLKGCFFDPWGEQYTIVIDQNYNDMIDLTDRYTDFTESPDDGTKDKGARAGVGVFSLGKDNQLGKAGDKTYKKGTAISDDILSWQ